MECSKIIMYNNKSITISEKDKNFDKILKLISERLKSSKNIISTSNKGSIDKEVSNIKFAWKSIEFIYSQSVELKIKLNHGSGQNITLEKMLFLIAAETPSDFGSNMFLGKEQYNCELENINTDTKTMNKLLQIVEEVFM